MLNQSQQSYQTLTQFQKLSAEFATQTTQFELTQTYREWLAENPEGLRYLVNETQTTFALYPATVASMPC